VRSPPLPTPSGSQPRAGEGSSDAEVPHGVKPQYYNARLCMRAQGQSPRRRHHTRQVQEEVPEHTVY
jgi:hypothetical protein